MYTLVDLIQLITNGNFFAFVIKNENNKVVLDSTDLEIAIETIEKYKEQQISVECYRKNGSSRAIKNIYTLKPTTKPMLDYNGTVNGAEQYIIASLNKENSKLENLNEKLAIKLEALEEKYRIAEKELHFKDEKHQIELSKIDSKKNSGLSGLGNKISNVVEANPEILMGLIDRFFPQKQESLQLGSGNQSPSSSIWDTDLDPQKQQVVDICKDFVSTASNDDVLSLELLVTKAKETSGLISAILNRMSQQQQATA